MEEMYRATKDLKKAYNDSFDPNVGSPVADGGDSTSSNSATGSKAVLNVSHVFQAVLPAINGDKNDG